MPYHKNIQRIEYNKTAISHCQRAIEKVRDGSEKYSLDGSDDDEILKHPPSHSEYSA